MNNNKKIAILGGGNAAFAHAADLSLQGHEVRLFELPDWADAIAEVKRQGGIEAEPVQGVGLQGGFASIHTVTSDPALAIDNADVIFVVVPAFAQASFAEAIAPHVRPEQIVILSPGSFGGAVTFARTLQENGCAELPRLCEAQSMVYACRKTGPAAVMISGVKEHLRVAVFPAKLTGEVMPILQSIYPTLETADNVLWTWLSNPNPIAHPPITILNTGWLEHTGGDFLFYLEGMTPAVTRVVDALDDERIAVGAAFGLELQAHADLTELWYGHQAVRLQTDKSARELAYAAIKCEPKLDSRYLTEDLPFGLVPWENMAKMAGLETPICTAMINLGNTLLGRDFRAEGLTLERIGLGEMSITELQDMAEQGFDA